MSLTNREKVLLTMLIFVIAIGAFLYFLILPIMDKIKENSMVLEHDRIILTNLEQANETGVLTDKEKDLHNEIRRIEAILPTQVRIPEIYLDILYIADSIGLQQESFTMQGSIIDNDVNALNEEAADENFQKEGKNLQLTSEKLLILPISHIFKGTYKQIKNYIDEIQRSERQIDIVEYQISNIKEAKNLSASFLLHSYALVKDGQNYSEFVDYDFIKGNYGRNNPFTQGPLTEIEENLEEWEVYTEEGDIVGE